MGSGQEPDELCVLAEDIYHRIRGLSIDERLGQRLADVMLDLLMALEEAGATARIELQRILYGRAKVACHQLRRLLEVGRTQDGQMVDDIGKLAQEVFLREMNLQPHAVLCSMNHSR